MLLCLTVLGLGMAVAVAASASQATEPEKIARACAADIDRLCARVPPGEGRIMAGMRAPVTARSACGLVSTAMIMAVGLMPFFAFRDVNRARGGTRLVELVRGQRG